MRPQNAKKGSVPPSWLLSPGGVSGSCGRRQESSGLFLNRLCRGFNCGLQSEGPPLWSRKVHKKKRRGDRSHGTQQSRKLRRSGNGSRVATCVLVRTAPRLQAAALRRANVFGKLFETGKRFTRVPGPYQTQAIQSRLPEAAARQKSLIRRANGVARTVCYYARSRQKH